MSVGTTPAATPESDVQPAGTDRVITIPRRLPWWAAYLSAAAGGYLLDLASPGLAWWPLVFPAILLILAAVWQQRVWPGVLAGAVAGAAFWLPHISWLTLYLGPVPWLALSTVMVLWWAAFGAAAAVATRSLSLWLFGEESPLRRPRLSALAPVIVLTLQALTVSGLWVLREQLQGSWPYGGFPWGRVAHVLADSPFAQSVSWLGFAGLTGVSVLAGALLIAAAFMMRRLALAEAAKRLFLPALGGSLVLLLVTALLPAVTLDSTATIRVAAIQGNSKSGIFDDRESGSVFRDHLDATTHLIDELEASGERVDVIVWPENSAEFDVRRNKSNSRRLELLAARADAPIVIGSVLEDDDGSFTNSTLVWSADGSTGDRYDKRFPVPFAEYMPNRDFFHALVPDLVDLVQLDYLAGTRPAVLDVDTSAGPVQAGIAICFDIIFDQQAEAMVRGDAGVIFAQTNNADFGRTDESVQQLAIAKLRAIETGRTLVNISTVGTSAIIAPSGEDILRLETFTADAMVAEIPLVTGETPALRNGAFIAAFWMVLGSLGLIVPITARIVVSAAPGRSTRPSQNED